MFASLTYRFLIAGAIIAGSMDGAATIIRLTQTDSVGAAAASLFTYNSAGTGVELAIPTGWAVSETPLGLRANAPISPAAASEADGAFTAIEIDRSDLYNTAIQNDGCCRDIQRDPHTGQITVNKPLPPAPAPTTTPLNAVDFASQVVAELPPAVGAKLIGTRVIGDEQAALVSGLPDYGIPSVTVFIKHNGNLYTVIAMGDANLSPEENAVLTSIQFTN